MDYSSQAHRTAHDQSNRPFGQLLALVGQHMQGDVVSACREGLGGCPCILTRRAASLLPSI